MCLAGNALLIYLFIWGLRRFQHCTGHIMTGSWKGRENQYIQLVRVLYCKLPTNGKQLPAFPLEVEPWTEPRLQRWEARVLPLCHMHGPCNIFLKSFLLIHVVSLCDWTYSGRVKLQNPIEHDFIDWRIIKAVVCCVAGSCNWINPSLIVTMVIKIK